MRHNDESFDENEWTPEERARFEALSAERVPPSALKGRTTAELRQRGLVRSGWTISVRTALAMAAAAAIVFAAGAVAGYAAAKSRVHDADGSGLPAKTREMARIDSVAVTPSPTSSPARHVVWF